MVRSTVEHTGIDHYLGLRQQAGDDDRAPPLVAILLGGAMDTLPFFAR